MSTEEQIPPAAEHQEQANHGENADQNNQAFFARLRSQVEFYFSLQNLARDNYLRNMLTSEHPDMPSPRPAPFMCPVGVITNFPKVRDICAQSSLSDKPAAILMAQALEGSTVVTLSENWIGPANQQLPPPANMMGGQMGGAAMAGQMPPPRGPQYQMPLPYQPGPQGFPMNPMQGMPQGMMMIPPPPPPPVQQQGDQQGTMYQQQQPGMPYSMGPPQGQMYVASQRPESPSSASLESTPSLQKQQQQMAPPPQQQQPQTANKLDVSASSRVSVGTTSAASLSSMSGPGIQQQPAPMIGQQGGAYPLPTGPSPPPPMQSQPMQQPYPMGPPMQQQMVPGMSPPPPMAGPGGMQQPYPYYNPQMAQQVMYPPGNYMQQQGQGGPQQQQMQQGYPPHMGYGGMPMPPPHGYPATGPPPPYPYQGMQQYMDGYGGQGAPVGQYGYPPNPHNRQFNDHRHQRVGSPAFHGDHHGNKKKHDKKKKKNNNQHGHNQSQQHHRRDSYGSGSTGENNHFNQYSRNDNSSSPVGDHSRGGKLWKKQQQYHGSGEQFRKHGNNSSRYNRQQQLSSSDTSPNRLKKAGEKREIFTSSDFPGLGGGIGGDGEKTEKSAQDANVGCYASALLKKKELAGLAGQSASDGIEKMHDGDSTAPSATDKHDDVDSHTRQTEEMEKEILSEFHDLSLIGKGHQNYDDNNANVQHTEQQTVGTASPSTTDASLKSAQLTTNPSLPILPAGPFENDTADFPPEMPQKKPEPPIIDVTNSEDFPSRESKSADNTAAPSNITAEPKSDSIVPHDDKQIQVAENAEPVGVWGSKKLFSDVI